MGPSLWNHLAAAGDNQRRLFILGACVLCFLLFRALRRSDPEEPESVTIQSEREEDSRRAPESPGPEPPSEDVRPPDIVPLPIGAQAPEFALPSLAGEQRSLRSLLDQGKTILLLFSSPYCEPCRALSPKIGQWIRQYDQSLNIVVVSRGAPKDNLAKLKDLEASRVLLQKAFEISEAYGCTATPAAVVVGADGLVRSDLMVGGETIKELIASATGAEAPSERPSGQAIGSG